MAPVQDRAPADTGAADETYRDRSGAQHSRSRASRRTDPPHDPAAERSILGALLVASEAAQDVADLGVDDLFIRRHQIVYAAIRRLLAQGAVVDVIATADELRRMGRLDDAGGDGYLAELAAEAVALRVGHHVRIVQEHAATRRLVDAARGVILAAGDGATAADLRERLRHVVDDAAAPPTASVRDWSAVADDPPVEWLVDGIVPVGGLVVLAGEPAAGKTLLALDLALRAAHGLAWLGRTVRPATTLYLAGEGVRGLGARLRAWAAAHPAARPTGHRVAIADGIPNLTGPGALQQLEGLVLASTRDGTAPDLVVIDTLAMAAGGSDENDAGAVGAVLRVLADLRLRCGVAVLLLHHTRKPTTDRGTGRTQHDLRGSSAIAGAADVVLLAGADGDAHAVRTAKVRDGEALRPLRYAIVGQATGRGDERGPVVLPAGDAPSAAAAPDPAAQLAADVAAVVAAIAQHGRTSPIDAIGPLAGIGRDRGRVAVRLAVSRGELIAGGSTRDRWYDCPGRANRPPESSGDPGREADPRGAGVRVQTLHTTRPRGRANRAADHAEPIPAETSAPRESARVRASPRECQGGGRMTAPCEPTAYGSGVDREDG